jgi:penicillin-binding protein 1A
MCAIDGLPACETCPVKTTGVFELSPEVPAALQSGFVNYTPTNSAYTTTTDENGNTVTVLNQCHHTAEFMVQPGIGDIIAAEQAAKAAANAAAAAAAGQTAAPAPTPAPEAAPAPAASDTPAPIDPPAEGSP